MPDTPAPTPAGTRSAMSAPDLPPDVTPVWECRVCGRKRIRADISHARRSYSADLLNCEISVEVEVAHCTIGVCAGQAQGMVEKSFIELMKGLLEL